MKSLGPDTHSLQHQMAILGSPDLDAAYSLAMELREDPNPALLAALVSRLQSETDPDWLRDILIQVLGITLLMHGLSSDEACALLLQELGRPDAYESRKSAAIALGLLGKLEAVTPLLHLLENGEEDMVYTSILALGDIGAAQAVDSLCRYLKSEESLTRQAAAEALGKIGAEAQRAVPALRMLAELGTQTDKRSAMAALSAIESDRCDEDPPR